MVGPRCYIPMTGVRFPHGLLGEKMKTEKEVIESTRNPEKIKNLKKLAQNNIFLTDFDVKVEEKNKPYRGYLSLQSTHIGDNPCLKTILREIGGERLGLSIKRKCWIRRRNNIIIVYSFISAIIGGVSSIVLSKIW